MRITEMDMKEETGNWSLADKVTRDGLKGELEKWLKRDDEIAWLLRML